VAPQLALLGELPEPHDRGHGPSSFFEALGFFAASGTAARNCLRPQL
jgi:hypothetical protein